MCIIIMCNIELINKLCLYYIHSKEIRCCVITSNNAPVKECEVANFHEQTSDGYAYV